MRLSRYPIRNILLAALPIAFISLGCKKEESIKSYSAPKDEAPAVHLADAHGETPEPADSTALTAPAGLSWTLPAGWKQVPVPFNPVFMPVAAISVSPDHPDVLLTVSQMPDSEGARSDYANITRWAGILKMPVPAEGDVEKYVVHMKHGGDPLDVITLGGSVSESKLVGAILPHGKSTWVFKLSGPQGVIEDQTGAFADFLRTIRFDNEPAPAVSGPTPATPQLPGPAANPGASGLGGAKWTLPAGWSVEAGAEGSLRLATIRLSNTPAEIKVSKLGMIGGGVGMNVSRWRREVGLDAVDDAHADAGTPMKVGSQAWTLHDYTGPANGGMREIIAIAEPPGNTWYFKLAGPTDVVAKAKADFEQFIASIRFGVNSD